MGSWLPLKLQMLPSIANEIRNKITELNIIVKEIDENEGNEQWAHLL